MSITHVQSKRSLSGQQPGMCVQALVNQWLPDFEMLFKSCFYHDFLLDFIGINQGTSREWERKQEAVGEEEEAGRREVDDGAQGGDESSQQSGGGSYLKETPRTFANIPIYRI